MQFSDGFGLSTQSNHRTVRLHEGGAGASVPGQLERDIHALFTGQSKQEGKGVRSCEGKVGVSCCILCSGQIHDGCHCRCQILQDELETLRESEGGGLGGKGQCCCLVTSCL